MFSRQSLQQLKEKIDLIDLLSGFLPLKRMGQVYKACCPFHEEKSPSFQVQRGAQHYHCFGCGAHGDAFAFIMHQMGLGFNQAAEFLADRYQITLESQTKGEDLKRQRLVQLLQQAQQFFIGCLQYHPEGRLALEYLKQRGLGEEFITRYGIGYCPRDGQLMRQYLHEKRFTDDEMTQMGLLSSSGRKRDFFASRITFPILNYRSQVIAFSARKFFEDTFGGKYINSPETELFKKSKTLFGLAYSRARITKEKQALLVEGQIDTLRLIDEGLNFTVAALGTAFGKSHVEELKNLGLERVWILFDADAAGQEAACKVGMLLMHEGIEVRVAHLPEQEDPDSLVRQKGIETLVKLIEEAPGYIEFLVQHRSMGKDLSSPAVKTHLIRQLKEQIQQGSDPLGVYEGLRALARVLCVPEELVLGGVSSPRRAHGTRLVNASQVTTSVTPANLEHELLASILTMWGSHPSLMQYCTAYLNEDAFFDAMTKRLWNYLSRAYQKGEIVDFTTALLDEELDAESLLQTLASIKPDWAKFEKHLQEVVQGLVSRLWNVQAQQLRLEIQSGRLSDERALELAQKYASLRQSFAQVPVFAEKE